MEKFVESSVLTPFQAMLGEWGTNWMLPLVSGLLSSSIAWTWTLPTLGISMGLTGFSCRPLMNRLWKSIGKASECQKSCQCQSKRCPACCEPGRWNQGRAPPPIAIGLSRPTPPPQNNGRFGVYRLNPHTNAGTKLVVRRLADYPTFH